MRLSLFQIHWSCSLSFAAIPPPVSPCPRAVSQPCLILALRLECRLSDFFSGNSWYLEKRLRNPHFSRCSRKVSQAGKFEKHGSRASSVPTLRPRRHLTVSGTRQVGNSGLVNIAGTSRLGSPGAVAEQPDRRSRSAAAHGKCRAVSGSALLCGLALTSLLCDIAAGGWWVSTRQSPSRCWLAG